MQLTWQQPTETTRVIEVVMPGLGRKRFLNTGLHHLAWCYRCDTVTWGTGAQQGDTQDGEGWGNRLPGNHDDGQGLPYFSQHPIPNTSSSNGALRRGGAIRTSRGSFWLLLFSEKVRYNPAQLIRTERKSKRGGGRVGQNWYITDACKDHRVIERREGETELIFVLICTQGVLSCNSSYCSHTVRCTWSH